MANPTMEDLEFRAAAIRNRQNRTDAPPYVVESKPSLAAIQIDSEKIQYCVHSEQYFQDVLDGMVRSALADKNQNKELNALVQSVLSEKKERIRIVSAVLHRRAKSSREAIRATLDLKSKLHTGDFDKRLKSYKIRL